MRYRSAPLTALLLGLLLTATLAVPALALQDSDRDGLPDAVEEQLATDPEVAEALQPIGTFTRPEGPQAELKFARVELANVAKDRWLWAFHFQKPYTLANASLILYLDADNNPKTGRTGMGCEYMLTHSEGQPGLAAFAPDSSAAEGTLPRVALYDGVLYLCADCPLKQEKGQSVFRYSLLSETRQPYATADSTGWVEAKGPPNSDRKAVLTLDALTSDLNFRKTE
ncbi:MAG: hypothetical protein WCP21_23085, partial [Armatimonadota bacterium]